MTRRKFAVIIAIVIAFSRATPIGRADPQDDFFIYLPLVSSTKLNLLHTGIATY